MESNITQEKVMRKEGNEIRAKMVDKFNASSAIKELTSKASAISISVTNFKIVNDDGFQFASKQLAEIKGVYRNLKNEFEIIANPKKAELKTIVSFFRKPFNFLDESEGLIKTEIKRYHQAEENKRLALQRKLQAEAAAEQKKLADIAKAKAKKLREKGQAAKAKQVIQESKAMPTPMPIVLNSAPKSETVTMVDCWKGEFLDEMLLMKAIVEGRAPPNLMMPNTKAAKQHAVALKGTIQYDGIRFYNDKTVASKSI